MTSQITQDVDVIAEDLQDHTEPTEQGTVRTRQYLGHRDQPEGSPKVLHVYMDGNPIVKVWLFGIVAERLLKEDDRYMILDAEDLPRVFDVTEWWCVAVHGDRSQPFIARGGRALAKLARQSPGSSPNVPLTRVIMNAEKDQAVVVGPDFRDLRKCNLCLVGDPASIRKADPDNAVNGRQEVWPTWAVVRAFEQNLKDHPVDL